MKTCVNSTTIQFNSKPNAVEFHVLLVKSTEQDLISLAHIKRDREREGGGTREKSTNKIKMMDSLLKLLCLV